MKRGKLKVINKKGLSNIIATVLIILLALAAVVIVWQFIRPTIERGGSSVSLESKCLEVEAKPTGCTAAGLVTIQLVRGNAADINHLIGIIESDTGARSVASTVATAVPVPATLGTTTVSVIIPSGGNLKAKAAVVVKNTAGETRVCQESIDIATCA